MVKHPIKEHTTIPVATFTKNKDIKTKILKLKVDSALNMMKARLDTTLKSLKCLKKLKLSQMKLNTIKRLNN